jgi:type II secretory pathway pseudopilin PulG
MKHLIPNAITEILAVLAIIAAMLYLTLGSAAAQEPTWIEYDQLELQRRQTEALERMDQRQELQQWMRPLYQDQYLTPQTQDVPACDPLTGCY